MAHYRRNVLVLIVVTLLLIDVSFCNDNRTEGYFTMNSRKFESRQSKLITFNTQTNGDISMELAFNVPFIQIPIKKTMDMASGAIANVNIGAVVLAGAIALGIAVIIPGVVAVLSKNMDHDPNLTGYRSIRDDQENPLDSWSIVRNFDQVLTKSNMDTTSCIQRLICWTVETSSDKVNRMQGSSYDKIIDGLATNAWLQLLVRGTFIHSALQNGLNRINCSKEYPQCEINQKTLQIFAKQLYATINEGF